MKSNMNHNSIVFVINYNININVISFIKNILIKKIIVNKYAKDKT